jgi:hypothetical protein
MPRASATERGDRAPARPERESPVPRYFFNVHDGRDYPDAEGTELPDLAAVRAEALRSSGELLRGNNGTAEFWSGDDWAMNVTDEAGKNLLTLRFSGTEHV